MGLFKKRKARKLPPKFLDSPLRLLAVSIEAMLEKGHRRTRDQLGIERFPLTISKHNAIAFPGGVVVQGRVLATIRLKRPQVDDSAWVNLSRMLRHWLTDEEPFARVEVVCGGDTLEVKADEEGYFEAIFDRTEIDSVAEVKMRLPESLNDKKWHRTKVLNPPADFEHLIISDVDDTILETNAASIWKMIKTTLFGNVLTRQVFPGTTEFYRKLTGDKSNPVFYVTSSPWNLRGFMKSIFERNEIPSGGYFMTDWGLDKEKWFTKSHRKHKLRAIRTILGWYPDKTAIMLGDSGQKDPEIYQQIAEEFPERVALIVIRNVSRKKQRVAEINDIAELMRNIGIPFHICANTEDMSERFDEIG